MLNFLQKKPKKTLKKTTGKLSKMREYAQKYISIFKREPYDLKELFDLENYILNSNHSNDKKILDQRILKHFRETGEQNKLLQEYLYREYLKED